MPAGDRSRTWFPELVSALRQSWQPGASWEDVVALRGRLQETLRQLLVSRGIRPANVRCFHCGHVGPGSPPVITVRVLLALQRYGIAPEESVRRLDKAWVKHRKAEHLDMEGRPIEAAPPPLHHHAHAGQHS